MEDLRIYYLPCLLDAFIFFLPKTYGLDADRQFICYQFVPDAQMQKYCKEDHPPIIEMTTAQECPCERSEKFPALLSTTPYPLSPPKILQSFAGDFCLAAGTHYIVRVQSFEDPVPTNRFIQKINSKRMKDIGRREEPKLY
jgi:hypothetical protein